MISRRQYPLAALGALSAPAPALAQPVRRDADLPEEQARRTARVGACGIPDEGDVDRAL